MSNFINFRTDMADERVDVYKKRNHLSEIDGVMVTEDKKEGLKVVTVEVTNENGAQALSKEIGKYITIEIENIEYLEQNQKDAVVEEIYQNLSMLIRRKGKKSYDSRTWKCLCYSRRIRT